MTLAVAGLFLLPLLYLRFSRTRQPDQSPSKPRKQVKPLLLRSSRQKLRASQKYFSSPVATLPVLSPPSPSLPFDFAANRVQSPQSAEASPCNAQDMGPRLTMQDKHILRFELQLKREKQKESEDRLVLQLLSDSELEYESSDEAVPPDHSGSAMVAYTRVLAKKGRLRRYRAEDLERRRAIQSMLEVSFQDDNDDDVEVIQLFLDNVRPLTLTSERALVQRFTQAATLQSSTAMVQSFSAGSIFSVLRMVGNTSTDVTTTNPSGSFDSSARRRVSDPMLVLHSKW